MPETSALERTGKPLFFQVGNVDEVGITAPAIRRGDAIRTYVRSLSVMQKEALVISERTGAAWRLASDEGAYLDGDDVAPCPLSFLTTGMVCSYMDEVLALAKSRGIEISRIRLIQDNFYTMNGSALNGTMTGGAKDVELEAQVDSPSSRETIASLLHDATQASPLNGLLQRPHESVFSLTHNNESIECGRVAAIASDTQAAVPAVPAIPSLPDEAFERAMPAPGDWNTLIVKHGMTPKTDETTGFAGSSLAEQQDRTLHIRGICTLRPDGVKVVEQQLFNPHGSIFHFRCDEAPENGGNGTAPDACTYISAGIAFCFMTQFGRYAKILKKDLRDYRVVQDTHFSLGGASGGTEKAGQADPVETHVRLRTGENDAFAQDALDMAEQTCFLHALCRSELKVRVRIREFAGSASPGSSDA